MVEYFGFVPPVSPILRVVIPPSPFAGKGILGNEKGVNPVELLSPIPSLPIVPNRKLWERSLNELLKDLEKRQEKAKPPKRPKDRGSPRLPPRLEEGYTNVVVFHVSGRNHGDPSVPDQEWLEEVGTGEVKPSLMKITDDLGALEYKTFEVPDSVNAYHIFGYFPDPGTSYPEPGWYELFPYAPQLDLGYPQKFEQKTITILGTCSKLIFSDQEYIWGDCTITPLRPPDDFPDPELPDYPYAGTNAPSPVVAPPPLKRPRVLPPGTPVPFRRKEKPKSPPPKKTPEPVKKPNPEPVKKPNPEPAKKPNPEPVKIPQKPPSKAPSKIPDKTPKKTPDKTPKKTPDPVVLPPVPTPNKTSPSPVSPRKNPVPFAPSPLRRINPVPFSPYRSPSPLQSPIPSPYRFPIPFPVSVPELPTRRTPDPYPVPTIDPTPDDPERLPSPVPIPFPFPVVFPVPRRDPVPLPIPIAIPSIPLPPPAVSPPPPPPIPVLIVIPVPETPVIPVPTPPGEEMPQCCPPSVDCSKLLSEIREIKRLLTHDFLGQFSLQKCGEEDPTVYPYIGAGLEGISDQIKAVSEMIGAATEEVCKVDASAAQPVHWNVPAGSGIPQLICLFAMENEDGRLTRANTAFTIPFWDKSYDETRLNFSLSISKGNYYAELRHTDGFKLLVYVSSVSEGERIFQYVADFLQWSTSDYSYRVTEVLGNRQVRGGTWYLKYAKYYASGRENVDPTWKIDFTKTPPV